MGVPGQVHRQGVWQAQESSCFDGELVNALSWCGWVGVTCAGQLGG